MINIDTEYEVHDSKGRFWGNIIFKKNYKNTISGYLQPNKEFEEIRKIFLEHESAIEKGTKDETSSIISSLGVNLFNSNTGQKQNIDPVFVNKNYLLTCEQK